MDVVQNSVHGHYVVVYDEEYCFFTTNEQDISRNSDKDKWESFRVFKSTELLPSYLLDIDFKLTMSVEEHFESLEEVTYRFMDHKE